ncbi:type II toxin-antitoxin system HipA family toxin [Derxia lacustris]|uniref:type II toxin-antitoxin system HipA family toxin n=1 Tax=Derxia lacustris TaxID=764842 RepID=UPI000A1759B4|nr:HipA domain-containing protein [Derxia lacustris]
MATRTQTSTLAVFAHLDDGWAPAGLLTLDEAGPEVRASEFGYGTRYLARPNALEVDPVSLALGGPAGQAGVKVVPANGLAQFGGIRDAAPDAWGRRVIEAKLKRPANSLPESEYLLHAGSQRVGALDVRAGLAEGESAGPQSWAALDYLLEAAERIEAGEPVPAALEAIFVGGTALGGARPKVTVRDEQGVLWLAKFPSRGDRFDIPTVEAATLRLAQACGLSVPPVCTRDIGGRPVMLIRRFDRVWSDDDPQTDAGPDRAERRLAFISGLTLVGCDETESQARSYLDLAQAMRRHCRLDRLKADCHELFARMVFNLLVTNDDDYLRNHGFLWDAVGRGWRLSPLYDVLPRPTLAFERQLHLGVGLQGRAATLDNALSGCSAFLASEGEALALMDRVYRGVREWRQRFEEWGVAGSTLDQVASAFRRLDEVASPELRRRLARCDAG